MAKTQKPRRKQCYFQENNISYVDYKDVELMQSFLNERGKIRSSRQTGTSPQFQRLVAAAVKDAREMALLPYSVR